MYHKVYESCKILLANCDVVNWLDIEHLIDNKQISVF